MCVSLYLGIGCEEGGGRQHLRVFHLMWVLGAGRGGCLPRDWYTTCLLHFFTLGSPKIAVYETYFFDIVTTQYDHSSYISMF